MSHITLSHIMKIKKKGIAFFYMSRKGLKWRNPRWPPKYIKINIFTNNFATTYARDINNMSTLMFSSMKKPILSFVFRKKYCKVYIYANMIKTAANIVFADSFFSVLIMLGWFPYGDLWANVELSSLWMFCKT